MSDRANVPDEPPVLLPGRSARFWYSLISGLLFAGAGCIAIGGVVGALAGSPGTPLMEVLIWTAAAIGLVGVVAGVQSARAQLREQRHGYTTLYLRSRRRYWQLDPKTGEVLARPGEPRSRRRGDRAGRGS